MRRALISQLLMATLGGIHSMDRNYVYNPRQTPDIPRDDEGHAKAAQEKRERKAAKRAKEGRTP